MTASSLSQHRPQRGHHKNWFRWLCVSGWILLVSYLEFYWWWREHKPHMHVLMDASQGVLTGTPHWRAYQNRLLGPALVHALGWFSALPLKTLAIIVLLSSNTMLYVMCARLGAARGITGWRVAVPLLLPWAVWRLGSHYWSYPWDFVETHVLLMLAYLACTLPTAHIGWLVALFAVAITSRESALFIPLFIIIRAVLTDSPERWRHLVLALAMMVAGVVFVQATRHLLFVHSSLPEVGLDHAHAALGNHLTFDINQADWANFLATGAHRNAFILVIVLTMFYAWAGWQLWRRNALSGAALAWTMLAYMLAIVRFAHIKEGRIYQPVGACTALLAFYLWLHTQNPRQNHASKTTLTG